jgi:hypothetical protein
VNSGTYKPRLPIALWLFFTAVTTGRAAPVPDLATVHGIVTNAASGEGLRKAYLRLAPVAGKGAGYAAVTNDQGSFEIEKIEPGSYRLSAECVGFLYAQYDAELRLSADDKVIGIEIKLVPQAVLSGRVLDQDGDPWPHAHVNVFHPVWKKGHRHIELAEDTGSWEVDDRGEFRIASLAPGRYYVQAGPDATWENEHHPEVSNEPAIRQQPTWYPSSPDVESAAPITLAAGQQFTGIDIRLRRGTGSKLRIRGKLTGLQDIPALPSSQRQFGPRIFAHRLPTAVDEDGQHASIRADGAFEITGVPSGAYDVWVTQGFPESTILGRARVQVDDRDVENVAVELHPPQSLPVKVRIEGGDAANPPHIPIHLEPVDSENGYAFMDQKADGALAFDDVGWARYRVYVEGQARSQVYLKTLRYGNAESNDGTFTLASYGVPLELVFSTHGARISGTVTGKAAMPQVILIPDTTDVARREYATRAAVFDQNGVFSLEAIAPGSYKLYAFEKVPEDIWLDSDFLKEVESSGTPFDFAEGDAKTVQAPLLPKTETDRILAKLGID